MHSDVRVLKEIRQQLKKAGSWVSSIPHGHRDEWEETITAWEEETAALLERIEEALSS